MEQKKWWQSKTIGGILLAAIGMLFYVLGIETGVELPPNADAEQIMAYYDQVKAADGNFSALISIGVSVIGFIMALVGRIKAQAKIK